MAVLIGVTVGAGVAGLMIPLLRTWRPVRCSECDGLLVNQLCERCTHSEPGIQP